MTIMNWLPKLPWASWMRSAHLMLWATIQSSSRRPTSSWKSSTARVACPRQAVRSPSIFSNAFRMCTTHRNPSSSRSTAWWSNWVVRTTLHSKKKWCCANQNSASLLTNSSRTAQTSRPRKNCWMKALIRLSIKQYTRSSLRRPMQRPTICSNKWKCFAIR